MPGVIAAATVHLFDPTGKGALISATAQDNVTGNLAQATLPAISPTNPPTAPQAGIGSIVVARGDSHYGGIVNFPDGTSYRLAPMETAVFVAQETLVWQHVGNAISATIYGVKGAPPGVIVNTTTPAWWVPELAPDGTIAWRGLFQ